jgi:hypothetical protein
VVETKRVRKNEGKAMMEHHGTCLCGKVTFEIKGDFEHFYLCHCSHCRKDTGSAHASNLFSQSAKLIWLSGEENIRTYTLPGTRHTKSFCINCGSALPQIQMNGHLLVVPAGCLDGSLAIQPDAHIFMASKAEWDNTSDQLPQFEQGPK